MDLVVCDNMNDPNQDRNCARTFVSDGVVATFNDFYNGDEAGAAAIEDGAQISRVGYNPGTAPSAVNSPYSFDFQAGGLGDTVAMVPGLLTQKVKKYAMLRVDVPAAAALAGFLKPMNDALGMTLTSDIPVLATTTDYTQYVLSAAQNGSGGAIIPLGNAQALQVLQAGHQVSSRILYSGSLGTLSQKDMMGFGSFAKQIILSSPVPPVSIVGNAKYPGLKQAVADFTASKNPDLRTNVALSNSLTGWMSVYAFVTIMKSTPPSQINRASVFSAFNAAKNVDMLGLIPAWTPSAQNTNSIFPGISNGDFTFWKWNGSNFQQFGPTVDVFKLLSGTQTSLNG
jgi:branched-chain amino acid transport system substrate-binding protein